MLSCFLVVLSTYLAALSASIETQTLRHNSGVSSYSDQYYEEDYQYGEETEEESVEEFFPVFLSSAHTITVKRGSRARLECSVDRLGPMVITWSRVRGNDTTYLATGSILMVPDHRLEVKVSITSSTLFILDTRPEDEGGYQCEVSSKPPAHIKLWLKLRAPPEVNILGRPSSGLITVRIGQELALICQGRGEPPPRLIWRRKDQKLPDGSSSISADQLIFSRVSASHSGTYTCQGGVAEQNVTVKVLHPPLVTLDQSYQSSTGGGAKLELVCTVQAVPQARVSWWKDGLSLGGLVDVGGRARVEYREPARHILTMDSPVQEDLGLYSCSANNTEGAVQVSLDLTDPSIAPKIQNLTGQTPGISEESGITLEKREKEEDNHRLLKHIVHKINKFDKLNHDIVSAIKESNRFLHQILRNQKKLLPENSTWI